MHLEKGLDWRLSLRVFVCVNDDINFEYKLVVAGDGQDKTAVAGKSGECPELNGHECGSCAGLGVVHGRIGYVNSFRMCGKVWNSHSRMGSVFFNLRRI